MRIRRGRYGEFLGCSRYPACRGTRGLPDRMRPVAATASARFWLSAQLSPRQRLLLRTAVAVIPMAAVGLLMANAEAVGRLLAEWLWRR